MDARIAVTGADGFLGRAVVTAAARRGLAAVPLGRDVDVRDADRVVEATRGCRAVLHAAGVSRASRPEAFGTNVLGTVHVLEAARAEGRTVVLASSLAARTGTSPYGLSKRQAEDWARQYARQGVDVRILRFSSLFGAGARWNSLAEMAASDPIRLTGDGRQKRDFLHVDDAADAMIAALDAPAPFESDVGPGWSIEMREVAAWFGRPVVADPRPAGPAEAVAAAPTFSWRPTRSGRKDLEAYVLGLAARGGT